MPILLPMAPASTIADPPSVAPRPIAGAHPGQWDAWTDRARAPGRAYSPDPDDRAALFGATADHLSPVRRSLGLARDAAFELAFARVLTRPPWVRACIMPHDALVLAEFVRALRPPRVLEIGTASGVSGAGILWALDAVGAGESRAGVPWLDTFDVSPACYFDPARPIGSAATEMVPSLAPRMGIHPGDAATARALLTPTRTRYQLAFIDACHDHPWPTLDLLWIAPLLAPDAWVVLHDVAYARILDAKHAREGRHQQGRPPKRSEFGPEALFEAWPFDKAIGDGWAGNIGAIHVPDPPAITPKLLRASLDRPWEKQPSPEFAAIARDAT